MFALIRNRTAVRILKSAFCRPALAGLAMVALIAGALLAGGGPALAHDPYPHARAQGPYVDLGVYGDRIFGDHDEDQLWVANYGTADAFGVRVVIEYGPEFYGYVTSADRYAGTLAPSGGSLTNAADNPAGLIWEIPRLTAKSEHRLPLQVPVYDTVADDFRRVPFVVVATVSSDSVEAESDLDNNRVEIWQTYNDGGIYAQFEPSPFSVRATVDNQVPQPGENIVFDVVAFYESIGLGQPLSDTVVEVQLTTGLTYTESSAMTQKFNLLGNESSQHDFSGYSHNPADNAGRWDIGPFVPGTFHLELTATVNDDAGGSEQCLTAEISGRPGEPLGKGGVNHSLDNIARVCVQPLQPDTPAPAVLSSGEVSLFTWYDCVGKTEYPCDGVNNANGDGLEAVVLTGGATASTIASSDEIAQPSDLVIHVPDHQASRHIAADNSIFWSTGYEATSRPGILIGANTGRPDQGGFMDADKWGIPHQFGPRVDVSGSVAGPSGGVFAAKWVLNSNVLDVWTFTNGVINDNTPGYIGYPDFRMYFEFTKLGTYRFTYTVSALHDPEGKENPNDVTDDTTHSDTEIYTFHVGPMADLAVDSVWETAQGLTVAVVNYGPDPSPGGQVVLNTGESCDFDHLHPNSEIATCTFAGAELAGTEVIGTIEDNVKYGVCIDTTDGSNRVVHVHGEVDREVNTEAECVVSIVEWHSVDMYDPNPHNNDIRGPADSPPAPGGVNVRSASTTIRTTVNSHRVNWEPVEELYGWEVSYYEVERLGLTSDVWQPVGQVTAPPYHDTDEARGTSPRYRVRAVNVAGQYGPWAETGISSASSLPRLTLALDPATIAEPDGQATVTARLNKASGQDVPITVSAELASGSDTADQPSFTLSENTQLMIPAGMLESTGAVTISANADDDGLNEQVRVSAVAAYVQSNIPAVTLTIQDDDAPGLVLSDPNGVTVDEGRTATYTVALNAQPSGNVHVRLYRGNNDITVDTDTGAGGVQDTLVFTPDNWNTPRTVTVGGVEDEDAAHETTTIRHSVLDGQSAAEYRSVGDVTLNVTVTDDDGGQIGVTVEPLTLNVTEGQGGKTYTVSLGTQPSGNVYITTAIVPAESGESGVRVSPATIILDSGNWLTGRTVTVSAVRDQDGADEMGTTIAHAIDAERTTATEYASVVGIDSVTVNVSDVDKPGVQVSPETLRITEGRSGSYNVKLNTQPTHDVTVTVRSGDTSTATVQPDKLTFTSTNWSSFQRVTVNAKPDDDAADDTTMLRHSVSSTDGAYNTGETGVTVTVSVTDPDRPGVTIGPLSPTPVNEAGWRIEETEMVEGEERSAGVIRIDESCTGNKIECDRVNFDEDRHPSFYTVRLDTKPTGNVVIDVKSDNDKVKVHPTSLTFNRDRMTWTVMVIGKDDADKDDEKATITHTVNAAASTADEYDTVTVRSLGVIVDDKDDPGVTLIVEGPLEVYEEGKGGDKTAKYEVVLDTQPDGVIVIGVESSKPGKVKVEPEFLWFTGTLVQHRNPAYGAWDEPQTITVTALDDADGKDETVTLIHKVVDANAHGWDVPIGAEVGRLTVVVRE